MDLYTFSDWGRRGNANSSHGEHGGDDGGELHFEW
jgi:hypothetical protein